jgi:hypothetical protein
MRFDSSFELSGGSLKCNGVTVSGDALLSTLQGELKFVRGRGNPFFSSSLFHPTLICLFLSHFFTINLFSIFVAQMQEAGNSTSC